MFLTDYKAITACRGMRYCCILTIRSSARVGVRVGAEAALGLREKTL